MLTWVRAVALVLVGWTSLLGSLALGEPVVLRTDRPCGLVCRRTTVATPVDVGLLVVLPARSLLLLDTTGSPYRGGTNYDGWCVLFPLGRVCEPSDLNVVSVKRLT